MAQIFSPRSSLYSKLAWSAVLALLAAGIFSWRALTAAPYAVGAPVEQPVPFSHKHHVGDDGIDCRYCHSAVETESTAGIPPISTCMTCHSQLYTDQKTLAPIVRSWQTGVALHWQRVHDLPGFVYFDHSIHIAKGVGCESCHGRVDRMPLVARTQPLSMAWCLECHRAPERHLRPRDKVFDMGWHADDQAALGAQLVARYSIDKRRLTDCSICHR